MTTNEAPAPGSAHHLAAMPALLALTAPQRQALVDVRGDTPGMGLHAARRQVLESHGLVTSQRVGTGRGSWTYVTLTDLGRAVQALILADRRAQDAADEANAAQAAQLRADREAVAAQVPGLMNPVEVVHPTTPLGMSSGYIGAADPFETDDEAPEPMTWAQAPAVDEPATEREDVAIEAAANGWREIPTTTTDEHLGYARRGVTVTVTYRPDGAIESGVRRLDGVRQADTVYRVGPVLEWLRNDLEADETQRRALGDPVASLPRDRVGTARVSPAADPVPGVSAIVPGGERIAELEALLAASRRRVDQLEGQADEDAAIVEGLAAVARRLEAQLVDEVAAHAGTRALAERQAAQITTQAEGYRKVRERVTELEDRRAPARGRFHDLVAAVQGQRDGDEAAPVSALVTAAVLRLGDALGVPIPGPFVVEPAAGSRPALVLVDEVVPEVVDAPEPRTVREALELDGYATPRPIQPLLPGGAVEIRECVRQDIGPALTRVYGTLYRRPDGAEVLMTSVGHHTGRDVPLRLVLPYLAAVRGEGFPGPSRRAALLEDVERMHGHPSTGR